MKGSVQEDYFNIAMCIATHDGEVEDNMDVKT